MATIQPPEPLEAPPRTTGNAQQDFPIVIDWIWKAYQVINLSVEYIKSISNQFTDSVLSGSVQISESNSSGSVSFNVAQPDENYVIILQAKTVSGTPATGAYTISSKTYTKNGFSFSLLAAPGIGTSIIFDWQLVRNTNV